MTWIQIFMIALIAIAVPALLAFGGRPGRSNKSPGNESPFTDGSL